MRRSQGLLLLLTAGLGLLGTVPAAADDRPAPPVVLGEIVQAELKQGRSFVGSVEAERTVVVDVQTNGYVKEMLVEAGDPVAAGAPLARLDTDTREIRRRAAMAQLDLRREELTELQNGTRPEEIEASAARLQEAQADVENALWKLEAVTRLRAEGKVSEEELREARRAHSVAAARHRALSAAHALLEKGPRLERIAQAQAALDTQQAEVDRLDDEKARCEVTAPFAGFVVRKMTEVGAWLDTGGPVAEIVALGHVDVVVPVLEDHLAFLREGMPVHVEIDALADPHLEGVIHRIVPVADARSRTAPVKIRITNTIEGKVVRIKPGMFARVNLPVGELRQALVAPKDAIVLGGRSPIVMVYDPATSTVNPVPVQLGVAVAEGIEIQAQLAPGTKVVIRGNERVFPGMKVRPVEGAR